MTQSPIQRPTHTPTRAEPRTIPKDEPQPLRPWHVVLLDDQDHTYEYVIDMLGRIFGYPQERGFRLAQEVDTKGRAVVATVHKELGELRVQQVRGFGADPFLARSKGPMRVFLEPAEEGSQGG